jgi:hypothetical protein
MSEENFVWGAPRIHGKLTKLGVDVSQATVSRYMPRRGHPPTHARDHLVQIGEQDELNLGTPTVRIPLRHTPRDVCAAGTSGV